ncbi:leucine-rich PPR motif-containing protein [Aphelenchoides avenae]|nr:leucine-rich PPR motif-containing protein [Aphelenchus avenae]
MCGTVMVDITSEQRLQILARFYKALGKTGIPISLATFNAILAVWRQNEYAFNPNEALQAAEMQYKLSPDLAFFNHILWRVAQTRPKVPAKADSDSTVQESNPLALME